MGPQADPFAEDPRVEDRQILQLGDRVQAPEAPALLRVRVTELHDLVLVHVPDLVTTRDGVAPAGCMLLLTLPVLSPAPTWTLSVPTPLSRAAVPPPRSIPLSLTH